MASDEPRAGGERETLYFSAEDWTVIDQERGEQTRYQFLRRLVLEGLARQAEERARMLRGKVDQR